MDKDLIMLGLIGVGGLAAVSLLSQPVKAITQPVAVLAGAAANVGTTAADNFNRITTAAATTTSSILTLPQDYWNLVYNTGYAVGQKVGGWLM